MAFCHKCGFQLGEDMGFCPKCGTKGVSTDAPSAPETKKTTPATNAELRSLNAGFISLACPKCGGSLECSPVLTSFNCKFCGGEFLLGRPSPTLESAKRVANLSRLYHSKFEGAHYAEALDYIEKALEEDGANFVLWANKAVCEWNIAAEECKLELGTFEKTWNSFSYRQAREHCPEELQKELEAHLVPVFTFCLQVTLTQICQIAQQMGAEAAQERDRERSEQSQRASERKRLEANARAEQKRHEEVIRAVRGELPKERSVWDWAIDSYTDQMTSDAEQRDAQARANTLQDATMQCCRSTASALGAGFKDLILEFALISDSHLLAAVDLVKGQLNGQGIFPKVIEPYLTWQYETFVIPLSLGDKEKSLFRDLLRKDFLQELFHAYTLLKEKAALLPSCQDSKRNDNRPSALFSKCPKCSREGQAVCPRCKSKGNWRRFGLGAWCTCTQFFVMKAQCTCGEDIGPQNYFVDREKEAEVQHRIEEREQTEKDARELAEKAEAIRKQQSEEAARKRTVTVLGLVIGLPALVITGLLAVGFVAIVFMVVGAAVMPSKPTTPSVAKPSPIQPLPNPAVSIPPATATPVAAEERAARDRAGEAMDYFLRVIENAQNSGLSQDELEPYKQRVGELQQLLTEAASEEDYEVVANQSKASASDLSSVLNTRAAGGTTPPPSSAGIAEPVTRPQDSALEVERSKALEENTEFGAMIQQARNNGIVPPPPKSLDDYEISAEVFAKNIQKSSNINEIRGFVGLIREKKSELLSFSDRTVASQVGYPASPRARENSPSTAPPTHTGKQVWNGAEWVWPDEIEFLSVSFPQTVSRGEPVPLECIWRITSAPMSRDTKVTGEMLLEADNGSVSKRVPFETMMQANMSKMSSVQTITIQPDKPPGAYKLTITLSYKGNSRSTTVRFVVR